MSKGYDSECLRLAQHFLSDEPKATEADQVELAQGIQDFIEGYLMKYDPTVAAPHLRHNHRLGHPCTIACPRYEYR